MGVRGIYYGLAPLAGASDGGCGPVPARNHFIWSLDRFQNHRKHLDLTYEEAANHVDQYL